MKLTIIIIIIIQYAICPLLDSEAEFNEFMSAYSDTLYDKHQIKTS